MVINNQKSSNCLSVFDYFVGLELKGLIDTHSVEKSTLSTIISLLSAAMQPAQIFNFSKLALMFQDTRCFFEATFPLLQDLFAQC